MRYEVLSPWGQGDTMPPLGLQPRVSDRKNKTLGLFAFFKEQGPLILKEVERQLQEKLPATKFSHFQYPRDTAEIVNDPEYKASFEKWLNGVDTVISGHGDAGHVPCFWPIIPPSSRNWASQQS